MTIYDTLNPEQKEAVFCTEGPLLMLAGAGSGKTRSLTHRIAYMIEEKGVAPWNILAITFTNKAAQEMRERVDDLLGYAAGDVWIATFHATCSRILRRYIDLLGYDRNFTIYDTSDQQTLMREVIKEMNLDKKQFPEKGILAVISSAKNECLSPEDYREKLADDYRTLKIADIYERYQKRLFDNNALDFDDLLVKCVELFRKYPAVLQDYQERFRYIMIDEYQDTNTVQFLLVSLLAEKYRNLCVVGDDDQSIYKFRGANIYNILNFEKVFPEARVIRLEQNYRSTKNILQAANEVIAHNSERKEKRLWTENDTGELVHFKEYDNEYEEAEGVVSAIRFLHMRGTPYKDMAILYRTNAQSRVFEERLKHKNIPYTIVRGISFYDRKEIKDLMSYLKVIDSGRDDIALKRIINVPRRGIGQTTINRLSDYALEHDMNLMDVIFNAREVPGIERALSKIRTFAGLIRDLRDYSDSHEISDLLTMVLEKTGYRKELEMEGTDESRSRLLDIDELYNDIVYYEDEADDPNLTDFLAEKDLYTLNAGIDNLDDSDDKVLLMTLHNAKGLEFANVFIGGMEEGVFPGYGAASAGDPSEIEEERRLCYVGITRAKQRAFLSAASARMVHGRQQYNRRSRFIDEIPKEYLDARIEKASSDIYRTGRSDRRSYAFGIGRSTGKKQVKLSDLQGVKSFTPDYSSGDRVRHIKFGEGTVLEIRQGGRDYEVTVDFDRVGKKRMFASFAKLRRVDS
ncbi:MAG: UvrD-helicase domain-containing protein [Eubacterium sp.]|nr:UvrD-helicase domain-containing protein [Eubacterium sp.]